MGGSGMLMLNGLTCRFGEHVAVSDLTLEIKRGEFVTLLGPSGCGKTTLLRMLAGLEQPAAGSIVLDGRDITSLPPERRPFNMVFQSYALFPHMSVFENVAYGPRVAGKPANEVRSAVHRMLDVVGLSDHADRPVQQLSGGMSQRVALARAVVNEPDVLLLDEPLAALDLQLRKRMQLELRALQHRLGTTFIFVTHDQEEALVMSHRIVLMNKGEVVQYGEPKALYSSPACRFAAEFIGETNFFRGTVTHVGDGRAAVEIMGAGSTPQSFAVGETVTIAPGTVVDVSVRPEDCQVVPHRDGDFLAHGIVEDTIFMGSRTIVSVRREGGEIIRAQASDTQSFTDGDLVSVVAAPHRGVVVEASS